MVTKVTRFFQDKLKEILFFFCNLLIYNIIHISQTKIPAWVGGDGTLKYVEVLSFSRLVVFQATYRFSLSQGLLFRCA